MGGEWSSLILVACKSRKMGPSFKAKSEGSQVRRGGLNVKDNNQEKQRHMGDPGTQCWTGAQLPGP